MRAWFLVLLASGCAGASAGDLTCVDEEPSQDLGCQLCREAAEPGCCYSTCPQILAGSTDAEECAARACQNRCRADESRSLQICVSPSCQSGSDPILECFADCYEALATCEEEVCDEDGCAQAFADCFAVCTCSDGVEGAGEECQSDAECGVGSCNAMCQCE